MRSRVDYHWPGTMAGDGKPVRGSKFYEGLRPIDAWFVHEMLLVSGARELGPDEEIIDRVVRVDSTPFTQKVEEVRVS